MRYYDTAIKNEIHEQNPENVPSTAIPMTDARVSAFFQELPSNHELTFDSNNLPIISKIPPLTAEQQFKISISELRSKRNNLLAKTDWTASSDLVMSNEMREYRQKLRDATEGLDTVEKIQAYTFPEEVLK
jgi:PBP1b-binding outer membrane lipoprotein LpoB